MNKILSYVLILLFFASCDDGMEEIKKGDNNGGTVGVNYAERTEEMHGLVASHYKAGNLLKENNPVQTGDGLYSFLWPYDAFVSGVVQMTELGYDVGLEDVVDGYQSYFIEGAHGNAIKGYGSSTDGNTGGGTRFYDDNSIVGVSLLEAYELTGEDRFLSRADIVYDFLKSGYDEKLGGALWWNEDYKYNNSLDGANKPTCANGYATLFLLKYYQVCDQSRKEEVLAFAVHLYSWLRDNLFDAQTKCYLNDVSAAGVPNTTKWTYNSAVMIQNGLALYEITKKEVYLSNAKETAQGAYDYFVRYRNGIISYPDHDPWFNTKLLRAYIDLSAYSDKADDYIKTYISFIDRGYEKARTDLGFFYEDWTGVNPGRYYSLLMQAAVVESYGAIANYKK